MFGKAAAALGVARAPSPSSADGRNGAESPALAQRPSSSAAAAGLNRAPSSASMQGAAVTDAELEEMLELTVRARDSHTHMRRAGSRRLRSARELAASAVAGGAVCRGCGVGAGRTGDGVAHLPPTNPAASPTAPPPRLRRRPTRSPRHR